MLTAGLILYFTALGVLALFGVHRLVLARAALRAPNEPAPAAPGERPRVCVQLPIYNELFVAERLIRAVAALRWPRERLEIQVLDDSTDETAQVVARAVEELVRQGFSAAVLRREQRVGFKAGALAEGLAATRAEVVAIFDADFVPPPDFLERTVPRLLADPRCGMVQARWGHLNRARSLLTRAQAVFLDGHFGIEHKGRAAGGLCFNFNGTAGVWRRQAIEDAGGWRDATITEDLELSYRVQLRGWRFAYLDQVIVPAELPETWSAFRSQQARWTRGSVETARIHVGRVLAAEEWSPRKRLEAFVHLAGNGAYLLMAVVGVLLPVLVVARDQAGWRVPGGQALLSALDLTMLGAGTTAMVVFYVAAFALAPKGIDRPGPWDLPFALCLGAGMSVSNGREVLRGLFAARAEFVRTPKRGDATGLAAIERYKLPAGTGIALVEAALALHAAAGLLYAIGAGLWGALPFLLFYAVGFGAVGGGTLLAAIPAPRAREKLRVDPA